MALAPYLLCCLANGFDAIGSFNWIIMPSTVHYSDD